MDCENMSYHHHIISRRVASTSGAAPDSRRGSSVCQWRTQEGFGAESSLKMLGYESFSFSNI